MDGATTPVVVAEIPPAPTMRAAVDGIYGALGYVAERSLTAEGIVKDLKTKVDLLGVSVMLLDEAHHILQSREQAMVTEFLKSLLNRLGCNLILAGLDDLKELRSSLQLGRRLQPDIVLRPYSFQNTAERLEFMTWLRALDRHAIKLPGKSVLGSQDVARRLYAATGGLVGIVTKYLSHAVLLAKLRGIDRIDLDLLAEIDAGWCGPAEPVADIGFDVDLELDETVDVAQLLAGAGRPRIDDQTNPFKCPAAALKDIYETRMRTQLVEPQQRKLGRPMKGVGADPQSALR